MRILFIDYRDGDLLCHYIGTTDTIDARLDCPRHARILPMVGMSDHQWTSPD